MTASSTRRRLRVGACLSLSGRYALFGRQAAIALAALQALNGSIELVLEDDRSDRHVLEIALAGLIGRCDLLLGPYSTQLTRVAGRIAAESDQLLWNHGGAGDDVEAAHPGHVASVLTPTIRYAEPFLDLVAEHPDPTRLWIVEGKGAFGRQIAAGAIATAQRLGIEVLRIGPDDSLLSTRPTSTWDLLSAGTFEDDLETVRRVRTLPHPPRLACSVAAGVRPFADVIGDPEGLYGIAQWFPGTEPDPQLGPAEADILAAYTKLSSSMPDYPAVQAAAAAVLATHCAHQAGSTAREDLWSVVTELDTSTMFGGFRIDPATGAQVRHTTVLTRWTHDGLTLA